MSDSVATETRELAFYYPNPMWYHGDCIKNLVLFFDGIALLVPNYMKRRPEEVHRGGPEAARSSGNHPAGESRR